MQNHDTKMLPNFIELFYVTIIAFGQDHYSANNAGGPKINIFKIKAEFTKKVFSFLKMT